MLLRIVSILFPIFAIVAAGYLYARRHAPEMGVANRLNMDIFVPALVFAALADRDFAPLQYLPLALGALLVLGGCGLLAWLWARCAGIASKTLVPPMMFNNSGNSGLTVVLLGNLAAALVLPPVLAAVL